MKKFGIDISRWQGEFDFDKAIAEGVEFVIIKAGGGDDGLYVDKMFERNYSEAKKRNLPVGCYWFSKALDTQEAVKEADWFYKNALAGKQFELPIYMDVEHKAMMSLEKDKLTEIVRYFCERLEAKGCFVGIYSSKAYFETKMHDNELQDYAHWVAQWAKNCTYKGNDNVLGMWQFGGETNAIRTNKVASVVCDQNYMLVDYPAMIKKVGKNGYKKETETKTETKVEPKPVKETVYTVKKGDTLSVIAAKYNTDYMTLAKYNGIADPDVIKEGQKIRIPNGEVKAEPIKKGDKVKVLKNIIYGTNDTFKVYYNKYDVLDVNGDRIVIGIGRVSTAAVSAKHLTKV